MKYFYFLFFTFLFLLGLTFGIQNAPLLAYSVAFQFHLWFFSLESLPMPLGGALFLAFSAGILFSVFWFLVHELKLRRDLFHKGRELKQRDLEIRNLRQTLMSGDTPENLYAAKTSGPNHPQPSA